MNCNAFIFDFDNREIADAIDPHRLAASGKPWEQDVNAHAPWEPVDNHKRAGMPGVRVWQSGRGSGDLSVIICGRCGSSMDVARYLIRRGLMKPWDAVLALEQTAGRGQYGRGWISLAGNIYAAWHWPDPEHFGPDVDEWGGLLSLVAGYILMEGFEKMKIPVRIKWPNDLTLNGKKFGGILVEIRPEGVIVGIGINIESSPPEKALRDDFALRATHLHREGFDVTPLGLWIRLAETGRARMGHLLRDTTPEGFIERASRRIAWFGTEVRVETGTGETYTAVIAGLSRDGGLRLHAIDGEHILYAGRIVPA